MTTPIKFTDPNRSSAQLVLTCRLADASTFGYRDATPADLAACGYVPRAELDRVAGLLGNLLARIHGDGGHRQVMLGDEEAAAQADAIVARMFSTIEGRGGR